MPKFRKLPVEVEARKVLLEDMQEIVDWMNAYGAGYSVEIGSVIEISIHTLEGDMKVYPGDWIIKGIANEFYPCKDGIFQKTYEPV